MGLGLAATLGLASSDVDASGKTQDTLSQRTFATLGVCNTASSGSTATITDGASSPTWNMAATGGGITTSAVYCDGTSWKVYAGAGGSVVVATAHMAPPNGPGAFYTTANLIAEDSFTTTSLNTALWNNNTGTSQFGRFNSSCGASGGPGNLPCGTPFPSPYSGSNCDTNHFCVQSRAYYDPYPYGYGTQLVAGQTPLQRIVDSTGTFCGSEPQCLAMSSQPSTGFSSNIGATWSSGSITSYTNGTRVSPMRMAGCSINGNTECFFQARVKFPDCRYGNWSDIWFLADGAPGANVGVQEFDLHECGFQLNQARTNFTVSSNNRVPNAQGSIGQRQVHNDVGVDITQAYHIYGVRYVPNVPNIQDGLYAVYFDNSLIAAWSTNCAVWDAATVASCNATTAGTVKSTPVSSGDYEVIIQQEVAQTSSNSSFDTCVFHTCPDGVHNGPFVMYVNDVQLYRK